MVDLSVTILIILMIVLALVSAIFVLLAIRSKAYISYRKKLQDFEKRKRRIEEELQNERTKFKRNS